MLRFIAALRTIACVLAFLAHWSRSSDLPELPNLARRKTMNIPYEVPTIRKQTNKHASKQSINRPTNETIKISERINELLNQ